MHNLVDLVVVEVSDLDRIVGGRVGVGMISVEPRMPRMSLIARVAVEVVAVAVVVAGDRDEVAVRCRAADRCGPLYCYLLISPGPLNLSFSAWLAEIQALVPHGVEFAGVEHAEQAAVVPVAERARQAHAHRRWSA